MTAIRYGEMVERLPKDAYSLAQILPGEGPLELDIGFGLGRSLWERHARSPQSRLIGIEVKAKLAHHATTQLGKRGIQARAFWGDAREDLARATDVGSVAHVYVHFPDPWWKKRHQKRMVMSPELLTTLARLLQAGGTIFYQTDVIERFEEAQSVFAGSSDFETTQVDNNAFGSRSNREVRCEADEVPIYRLLATRKSLA